MGFGINDAGSVVGMSAGKGGERAFYWSKSRGLVQLTTSGTTGAAYAIAGKPGNIEYAVGYEESGGRRRAVIWVAPPSLSPVPLSDNGSLALGVNDAGTAVGSSGGVPVIWTPSGSGYTPTHIGFLPNQAEAYATAIDNDGIVVGYGYDSVTFLSRAFVRLPSGTLVPLDPVPGDVKSTAQAVSDKVGPTGSPFVYVAGSTTSAAGVQRAVRWKVDLATGNLLETKVLSQTWAEGVNGSGDVAGTLNGSRGKQSATLWRNDVYTTLPPPKGATGGTSRGIAQTATSPMYVVGQTTINNWPRAVVWVVQ
jgi:probable HAF family extracellular repeat protein